MAWYLNGGENDGGNAFPFTGDENEIRFFDPSYGDPRSPLNDDDVVDHLLSLSEGDDVIAGSAVIAGSDVNPPEQDLLDLGSTAGKSSGDWDELCTLYAAETQANAAEKQSGGKSPKESTGEWDERDDFEEESLQSDDDDAAGSADSQSRIIKLTHALEEAKKKKREHEEMARGYEQTELYYEQELRRLNCEPGMLMGAPQTHFTAPMIISPMMVSAQEGNAMIISPMMLSGPGQKQVQQSPMLPPTFMFPVGRAPDDRCKNSFRDGMHMLAPSVVSMANKKRYAAMKERLESTKKEAAGASKKKTATRKKK